MKKENFFLIIAFLLGMGTAWIWNRKNASVSANKCEIVGNSSVIEKFKDNESKPVDEKENIGNNLLVKEKFSVKILPGWKETQGPPGVSGMIVNVSEKIINPAAQKINFQSYYAVNYDTMRGRNFKEHAEYEKQSLVRIVPNIFFISEKTVEVDGRDVYFIEAELNQQGLTYKILIAIIQGKNNDIWTISFNTTRAYWYEYQNIMTDVVKSFQVK